MYNVQYDIILQRFKDKESKVVESENRVKIEKAIGIYRGYNFYSLLSTISTVVSLRLGFEILPKIYNNNDLSVCKDVCLFLVLLLVLVLTEYVIIFEYVLLLITLLLRMRKFVCIFVCYFLMLKLLCEFE